jgi:hypothetical protein
MTDFLEPRGPDALAATLGLSVEEVRELLHSAAIERLLVRVKQEIYYHPAALAEAMRQIVRVCERDGSVTIASLRDQLCTSRKYAQALLEHFDAIRITRRRGDAHFLRRGADSAPV